MKKTKIGLKDIADAHPEMDYLQLYEYIMQMVDNGEFLPVKRAKTAATSPALKKGRIAHNISIVILSPRNYFK